MSPSEIREQISNQLDTPYSVDFANVNEATFLVQNIASIFLGVISYSIVVLLTLITAVDIAYLTIPVVREKIHGLKWDGTKNKYLRVVSRDAMSAVELADTIHTGRSSLGIYLLKRIKTYIISVTVLMLLLGYTDSVKKLIVKIVLSIVQAIYK